MSRFWRIVVPATTAIVVASVLGGPTTSASAAEVLLSQDRPAIASSYENSGVSPAAAFDSDPATRWSSNANDQQWLRIDLGWSSTITKVVLQWENAYGKSFEIQTSANGSSWAPIYATTSGTGGTQTLAVSGLGRYVRMLGTQRGTGYGYVV